MSETRTLDQRLPVHGHGMIGTPWWGMMTLIATEGVLFAYLIFSYAYLGSQGAGPWPTSGPPSLRLALPATVLLLGSSFVLEWGKQAARKGRLASGRIATAVTLAMGIGFAALEIREWLDKPYDWTQGSYASIYFLLTGTHLVHVALGLLGLLALLGWSLAARLHAGHEQHRALVTLYWHFVDAVWLFVFCTIYLSPRLA
jgi:heme/copper-type cytochrome/quinol oxidase subunit 3